MTIRYAKLRGRIVEKFGTLQNFAKALGVHSMTVSRKLNGLVGFSGDDMLIWADLLGIDIANIGLYFFEQKG